MKKLINIFILVLILSQYGFSMSSFVFAHEDNDTAGLSAVSNDININNSSLLLNTDNNVNSASIRQKARINRLKKTSFRSDESVEVTVDNPSNVNLTVTDPTGKVIDTDLDISTENNSKIIDVNPPKSLRPGKYKLQVTDSSGVSFSEEFIWGVLAINSLSDVYEIGDKVDLQIAVLDEKGFMVCDAKVDLTIKKPDGDTLVLSTNSGGIKVTDQCNKKDESVKPDYVSSFTTDVVGKYELSLKANTRNGEYSINSSVLVDKSKPFKITRNSPTRLYPPVTYPVRLQIEAKEDFDGIVTESIPEGFLIKAPNDSSVAFSSIKKITSDKSTEDDKIKDVLGTSIMSLAMPFRGYFPLTQGFGSYLTDPILKRKYAQFGLIGHDGADFALPRNTSVTSVDDGVIILAKERSTYGTTIVVKHTWGQSYYGHLNVLEVKEGDKVLRGQEIGLSGNTGLSTGPHLHFGMKLNNNDINNGYYGKINPLPYLGIESSAYVSESQQILTWKVSIKKGEKVTLGYNFVSPNKSPQFYTMGPAKFFKNKNKVLGDNDASASDSANLNEESNNSSTSAELSLDDSAESTNSGEFSDDQLNISDYEFYYKENRAWELAVDSQTTIDADVSINSENHSNSNSTTVFTGNQTGYTFYSDADGICKYAKTNDGGISWDAPLSVDDTNQTDCMSPVVWYDQWTPGDNSGTIIHIIAKDSSDDDIWYRELDTTTDSFVDPIVAITSISGTNKTNSFSHTENRLTITKATDNAIYVGVHDDTDSFVIKCSSSCGTAGNWSDKSPVMLNQENADLLLMPLANNDVMAIRQNITDQDIEYAVYDQSGDSWSSWSDIDSDYNGSNTEYLAHISATLNKNNNKIYLAYRAGVATLGSNDEIRTAVYNSGSWTSKSNVVSASSDGTHSGLGVTGQALSLDETTGAVYVIYTARTNPTDASTGNVYYRKSFNDFDSFDTASNPINNNLVDLKGVNANLMSDERIYAVWHDDDKISNEPLYGETVIDLLTEVKPEMLLRHGRYSTIDGTLHPFIF